MIFTISLLFFGFIGVIVLFEEWKMPYMPIVPMRQSGVLLPSELGLQYENLDIDVENGLILRGYFIHALGVPKATIILLHGIGSNKENWLRHAQMLAQNGFNAVVYDQRAHGKSDGDYCTFGFYEKYDVSKFVDILLEKMPTMKIGVQGASLGGAVALQVLAHDKRLGFGIVESTFNTLENVVEKYGYDYFRIKSRWLARRILTKSAIIARFRPFEIQPMVACRHINQPVLIVHGDADDKIPIDFDRENFAALSSINKEFYVVKGAGHDNVGEIGGKKYQRKIFSFLQRALRTPLSKIVFEMPHRPKKMSNVVTKLKTKFFKRK